MPLPYTDESIITNKLDEVIDKLDDIFTLLLHIHKRHIHPETSIHFASDLTATPQGNNFGADNPVFGDSPAIAGKLVQEFFGQEDLDANSGHDNGTTIPAHNSIYGRVGGFMINDTDIEFPLMLEGVHNHPDFASPEIIITWQQYLATLGVNA
jgi:hypothetical protein